MEMAKKNDSFHSLKGAYCLTNVPKGKSIVIWQTISSPHEEMKNANPVDSNVKLHFTKLKYYKLLWSCKRNGNEN